MDARKYLIFALDVKSTNEAKALVRLLAPVVGGFKVGLELFMTEGPRIITIIKQAGAKIIFLDLKFHDIPTTMRAAVKVASSYGVNFLSCYCEQIGIFEGLELGCTKLLGVTLLTSQEIEKIVDINYHSVDLHSLVIYRARLSLAAGCSGIICSGVEAASVRLALGSNILIVCPGIRPVFANIAYDQKRIATPQEAIVAGANYIVVGRPIRDAVDPLKAAIEIVKDIKEGLQI